MIKLFSTPMLGVLGQSSSFSSSQSLSSGTELENRVPRNGLEPIGQILTRISATLDRQPMGKLSEQEEGRSRSHSPQNQKVAPLPVTASYPHEGGVA